MTELIIILISIPLMVYLYRGVRNHGEYDHYLWGEDENDDEPGSD